MRGSAYKAAIHTGLRIVICMPIGLVILLLFVSVIGIPLGFAIGLAVGAWCTKPLRRHPVFNVKGDAE
jgi:hypothetical protein